MPDTEFSDQPTVLVSEEAARSGTIAPGTVLFGAYEVLNVLGSGGMGAVYRARHRGLGSLRAIKVMHPGTAQRPELVELFHREAHALLEVHHEAVVRCHDLLRGDDGRIYLVMEMIEGQSLSDRIGRGPLSENEVWALGARVAAGLAAAHERGVVHRDLSPDNIVLPQGRPEAAKLIDFGIAKVLDAGEKTVLPGFKGKLAYASPEQLGLFGGRVDARSDLYSLGLVLAVAASGAPLPMGSSVADAVEVRLRAPALPRSIPASLRAEIEPLLAPDPANRPPSARLIFRERPRPKLRWSRWVAASIAAFAVPAAAVVFGPSLWSTLRPATGIVSRPVAESPLREHEVRPIPLTFASVRERLLGTPAPWRDVEARVWTTPDPVPSGSSYTVSFEAACDCDALLFAVEGATERISLLYPNAYEPPRRLRPADTLRLPSSSRYTLDAVGEGEDTLKLLLIRGDFGFPSEGTDVWTASPSEPERVKELADLLEHLAARPWASAQTQLRIVR